MPHSLVITSMASAGLHKRSRNRFCGDVDALAAQVSAIAVAKGRSFCKWPDESETLGEAALHVDKVEPEHDLLLVLKRAQDNLCFSRKQVETVVEKVITESKWTVAATDRNILAISWPSGYRICVGPCIKPSYKPRPDIRQRGSEACPGTAPRTSAKRRAVRGNATARFARRACLE